MISAPVAIATYREAQLVCCAKATPRGLAVSGMIAARPDTTCAAPVATAAPCTRRKSIARGVRHETRCVERAMELSFRTVTVERNRNAGRSAQKGRPKLSPRPGQPSTGSPAMGASLTGSKSKMPNATATTEPTTMPMMDAHTRTLADPLMSSPMMTANVTRTHTGPAASDAPSGTLFRSRNRTGTSVTSKRIRMAPLTAGVMIRRSRDSRSDNAIWNTPVTSTSAASVPAPPSCSARTQKGIVVGDGYGTMNSPAPSGPARYAITMVAAPLTMSIANTAHVANSSELSAACASRIGINAMGAAASSADCTPRLRVTASEGRSSASYRGKADAAAVVICSGGPCAAARVRRLRSSPRDCLAVAAPNSGLGEAPCDYTAAIPVETTPSRRVTPARQASRCRTGTRTPRPRTSPASPPAHRTGSA